MREHGASYELPDLSSRHGHDGSIREDPQIGAFCDSTKRFPHPRFQRKNADLVYAGFNGLFDSNRVTKDNTCTLRRLRAAIRRPPRFSRPTGRSGFCGRR